MKNSTQIAEEIRHDKKLMKDIREAMESILYDEQSTASERIQASEVILWMKEVKKNDKKQGI